MGSANERRQYYVTPSVIGWAHTQNDPSIKKDNGIAGNQADFKLPKRFHILF